MQENKYNYDLNLISLYHILSIYHILKALFKKSQIVMEFILKYF